MERLRALLIAEDDERRALERALHDGVQQQVVSLAVNLQLARRLLEQEPAAAAGLLDEVRADVGRALDGVRELAAGIHPALLDVHGLDAALRSAADGAPVPTAVDGALGEPVSPVAAVTVYRCAVAALGAVVGEGSRATMTLRRVHDAVELELVVVGGGVEPGAFDALAGRVEALGGTFAVGPRRVELRLPLD